MQDSQHLPKMHLGVFTLLLATIGSASGHYYDDDDYYFPLSIYGRSSPNCAPECNCPESYPTAMYCDELKLKSVPIVPP